MWPWLVLVIRWFQEDVNYPLSAPYGSRLFSDMRNDPATDREDATQNIALKCLEGRLRRPSRIALHRELLAAARRRSNYERCLRVMPQRGSEVGDSWVAVANQDAVRFVAASTRSEQQRRIVGLLLQGKKHRAIANHLGIAPSRVTQEIRDLRQRAAAAG